MSHITTMKTQVKDLDALSAAARELGGLLVREKKTYNWFGQSVGDYPLPKGVTKEQLGHCDHAIQFPGVNYEIGVVKTDDGYKMAYDFFGHGRKGSDGKIHDGQSLLQKCGKACSKLAQLYSVHAASIAARKKGYTVTRTQDKNGSIQLAVAGGGL